MEHGLNGYARGCRCPTCKAANAAYQAAMRKHRRAVGPPSNVQHGASCYSNWGCRCDICKTARSEYEREHGQRKKAKLGINNR